MMVVVAWWFGLVTVWFEFWCLFGLDACGWRSGFIVLLVWHLLVCVFFGWMFLVCAFLGDFGVAW